MKPTLTLDKHPKAPGEKYGWPWTGGSKLLPEMMDNGSSWPRISIVTPSYNQGQYIEETLRSVLLQGYPNLEYLVLDGDSQDESIEILRSYEDFLSFLRIGADDGQSAAINEGFEKATGDILAWLNSDDRYLPGTLVRIANFFSVHPETVFVSGDVNIIDSDSQFIRRIYATKPNRFISSNTGVHGWPQQGCFWRKSAYEMAGGIDRNLVYSMDFDLFVRLISTGRGRRIPGPPLAEFRIHPETKTAMVGNDWRLEKKRIIEKYGSARWRSRKWLLDLLWWFWRKPTVIRRHMNQIFGIEY
jgi:glycosyltransferase involved in cell wall biosynthesis